MKRIEMILTTALVSVLLTACGGGGSGGGGSTGGGGSSNPPVGSGGGSAPIVYGPYETVFGEACQGREVTPGCTFNRSNGKRVNVIQDPHYDRYGYDEDDLWFVKFDANGIGRVYDDLGNFQYTRDVSKFAGYISGTTIGVGTSGLFWENIAGGTYWLGKNGVLYSANTSKGNFGDAINNKESSEASDANFAALNSDANKALIKAGADKLVREYGFTQSKAQAVASALNSWAVAGAERGFTTEKDMSKTFKSVFGVEYSSALAAAQDLTFGNATGMRELTNRSAAALGLKPSQAQKFVKGMYKKSLANWGFDADSINW